MAFQVHIRINKNTVKVLSVASSSEEFENFTIGKLKERALSLFPGVSDPERLRVIFGQDELEDDQTFESCNIEHMSLLIVVLTMPGGGPTMAFQVRIRINRNTIKALTVASSSGEFEKFTIGKLKERALSLFPGVSDPERLRVIFGQDELEDDQTFKSCNIEHLSLLIVVITMPRGGRSPDPGGTKSQRRVNEGFSDRWKVGSSLQQRGAEIPAQDDDMSLSTAVGSLSITDRELRREPSSPSDDKMRNRTEETAYDLPAGASAVPSDPDLQFVLNLLPSLKRMDLRRREHTKLRIQQLVFDAEFNERHTINVKSLTGKTLSVDVDSEELENMSVEEFRRRLDPTAPVDRCRLIYAGRQLEDHKTLRDYGITYESTMYWVDRPERDSSLPERGIRRSNSNERLRPDF